MGWHGVDFDGTLARHEPGDGIDTIGEPVPAMLMRIRAYLAQGREVRIVTARASIEDKDALAEQEEMIAAWCLQYGLTKPDGSALQVTCRKDFGMIDLLDDRAVQVTPNIGIAIAPVAAEYLMAATDFMQDPEDATKMARADKAEALLAAALGLEKIKPAPPPKKSSIILPH